MNIKEKLYKLYNDMGKNKNKGNSNVSSHDGNKNKNIKINNNEFNEILNEHMTDLSNSPICTNNSTNECIVWV